MSQATFNITRDIANTGATYRAYVNQALQALASWHCSNNAPGETYPCMVWADTGTKLIKQRDSTNTSWITIGTLNQPFWNLVSLGTAQTITAQHTFQPASAQPPFALGSNASNQKVTGLYAERANSGIVGLFKKLYWYTTNTNTIVLTCASITVGDGVNTYDAKNVNVTLSMAINGAGGMRVGLTEQTNTWYHLFVIFNPSTLATNILTDTSLTPTLPSGWSYYAYVGSVLNDSASNFVTTSNTDHITRTTPSTIITNAQTANASYTSIDLSMIVPSTAISVYIYADYWHTVGTDSSICLRLATDPDAIGLSQVLMSSHSGWGFGSSMVAPIRTAQTIYYNTETGGGTGTAHINLASTGWIWWTV